MYILFLWKHSLFIKHILTSFVIFYNTFLIAYTHNSIVLGNLLSIVQAYDNFPLFHMKVLNKKIYYLPVKYVMLKHEKYVKEH